MLRPASPKSWNLYTAAHLLNRAGFGGTPDEIEAFCKLGRDAAIELLLTPPPAAVLPGTANAANPANSVFAMRQITDPTEREKKLRELRQQSFQQVRELRAWWLGRMIQPATAPIEKATLFWHGHFATSIQKVKDPSLMARQNQLFRANAFGNFGTLIKAMSRDPAMMIWLDLQRSERNKPNENFAREVMELFTLGIGNYTEQDIKESARAFTGYRLNRLEGTFRYAKFQHDEGQKTFMGKTGNFSGDDIIDIILEQPACASFISRKLWTYYACEDPEPDVVKSLAAVLRNHQYELRPVFAAMFGSEQFYSAKTVRTQIKSPVQLIAQTCHILQCDPPGEFATQQILNSLGQMLFAPPNVKGWDGNRNWINTSTLEARNEFPDLLLSNKLTRRDRMTGENPPGRVNIDQIVPKEIQTKPEKLVDYLAFRVFQTPLTGQEKAQYLDYLNEPASDGGGHTIRDLLTQMMKSVQYQLV